MSCKVQYTIAGKRGSDDYTVCNEIMTKYHRVPLLGLYENSLNIIIIRLLDENDSIIASKKLRILIRGLDKPVHNAVELSKSTQPLSKDFIFVSGGYHGGVYAFVKKEISDLHSIKFLSIVVYIFLKTDAFYSLKSI